MSKLFTPTQVGPYRLSHRVVMAPLTRLRSDPGDIPSDLMVEYYTQRASEGGPIVSEATSVSIRGNGYAGAPGIYSDAQIAGWQRVTNAVHAKGGRIFRSCGMSAGSRMSTCSRTAKRRSRLLRLRPRATHTPSTAKRRSRCSAPELHEIPGILEEFRSGAERALRAGFDGVEIHGANGYLPDQFLQDGTNKRADEYGGPIENRARFFVEVTQAAISVWDADRVGASCRVERTDRCRTAIRPQPSATWQPSSIAWASPTFMWLSRASRAPRTSRTARLPSRPSICGRSSHGL